MRSKGGVPKLDEQWFADGAAEVAKLRAAGEYEHAAEVAAWIEEKALEYQPAPPPPLSLEQRIARAIHNDADLTDWQLQERFSATASDVWRGRKIAGVRPPADPFSAAFRREVSKAHKRAVANMRATLDARAKEGK